TYVDLADSRSRVAGGSGIDPLRGGGAGQETRRKDGLSSGRRRDSDSRRLRSLQRISLRRILPRRAPDASIVWTRRGDRSNSGAAIPQFRVIARFAFRVSGSG